MISLKINEILGYELSYPAYLDKIVKYAKSDCIVLLTGETGVGKSFFAKKLMEKSTRCDKPYDELNCGRLGIGTLESELFGHKKGSFTGAYSDKKGLFEQLNHGTLFMDEITETTYEFQTMLLKLLDNMTIRKIGDDKNMNVDVRLIFATNRDILSEVENRNFRQDLYFRIEQFKVEIPPLRERKNQIPDLTSHFIYKFNKKYNKVIKTVSPEVSEFFQNYSWPGNVRELEKSIEHAFVVMETDSEVITKAHLSEGILKQDNNKITYIKPSKPVLTEYTDKESGFVSVANNTDLLFHSGESSQSHYLDKLFELGFKEALNYIEKQFLETLLKKTKGNITTMSNIGKMSRKQIYEMIKKHNLVIKNFKK